MKMTLVDVNGTALTQLTTPDVKLTVGQSIRFDETPGPISVFGPQGLLRQERSAPLYLMGDVGGKPVGVMLAPNQTFGLTLVVGTNQDILPVNLTMRNALKRLVAPGPGDKDGCSNLTPAPNDSLVSGWSQNVTVLDSRDVTVGNFASIKSVGAINTEGQGLYCHESGGSIVVNDAYFDENGWAPGLPFDQKNQWRHNSYINKGKSITFNRCWMNRPASIGAKTMRTATFNKCLISLASIGAQPLYGLATYNDCIFYRGSYHFTLDKAGKLAPVGNCALDVYTDVVLNRCFIVGGPVDERLTTALVKPFNAGAIKLNKTHEKYTDVNGAKVVVGPGCEMHGWDPFIEKDGSQHVITGPGQISGAWAKMSGTKISVDLTSFTNLILNDAVPIADGIAGAYDAVRRSVPTV